MKRFVALLLVLVMVLPLGVPVVAEELDLTDEEAALFFLLLAAAMEEEENSNSTTSKSSSSTTKKSGTPAVPTSTAPVTKVDPYYANVKTNGGDLNVRAKANKGSTSLVKLKNGEQLQVLGYTGEWLEVYAKGKTGYVPRRYVSGDVSTAGVVYTAGSSTDNNYISTNYYAIVNPVNNIVNMRTAPNPSAEIKGVFYYGYQLHVTGEIGQWCEVYDDNYNQQGYVLKDQLLRVDGGSASGDDHG